MNVPLLLEHGGQITSIGRLTYVGTREVLTVGNDPADPAMKCVSLIVDSQSPEDIIEKALRDTFRLDGTAIGQRSSRVVRVEHREPLWLVAIYSEVIIET